MFGKRGSGDTQGPAGFGQAGTNRAAHPAQPQPGPSLDATFDARDEAPTDGSRLDALAPKQPAQTTEQQRADRAPSPASERISAANGEAPKQRANSKPGKSGFDQIRQAQSPVTEIVREQSDYYHATKTTIFNALLNTIDLAQLAKLDPKAAAEEIRDIVAELVAIKNVSMSVAEQENLVQDIINDVLGYGPLEPLLARDDIADIMVNGAGRVFIEVSGKVQLTNVRFRDNAQLMNICQRIVSQVGRRVDESSPICDARLPDGSRVNVIGPPLALDGPTLTIRKFKRDKLTMRNLVEWASVSPEGARVLGVIGASRCNVLISGGTGSGKTTLLNCMTAFINPRNGRSWATRRSRIDVRLSPTDC